MKGKYLNKLSFKELISVFSEINNKIAKLQKCSSDDFLKLNSHLKYVNNIIKIISGNTSKIFEITAGKKSDEFLIRLNALQTELGNSQMQNEKQINEKILTLEKILNHLNQIVPLLKNLKLDLMTLKFLATNLKLTSVYDNINVDKKNSSIEEVINKIKSRLTTVEKKLELQEDNIKEKISRLKIIRQESKILLLSIFKEIESGAELISTKNKESKSHLPELTRKIGNTSKNIENIIINLQYHDIIHQKMNHIQKAHSQIISNLSQFKSEDESKPDDQKKYFVQISEVAGLQAAQLILINREYQNAIEIITSSFQKIGYGMNSISNISRQISMYQNKPGTTLFQQIQSNLEEKINNLHSFAVSNNKISYEYSEFYKYIKELPCKIDNIKNSVFQILKIKKLPNGKTGNEKNKEKENHFPQIQNQIISITSKVLNLNSTLNDFNEKNSGLAKSLQIKDSKSSFKYDPGDEKLFHMEGVSNVLNSIDANNKMLDDILAENSKLCNDIVSEINGSIKKVKYYDLFDKTIEEIVSELNVLNYKLNNKYSDVTAEETERDLKDVRKTYTVGSEHNIHDMVISGKFADAEKTEDSEDTDKPDDDNIEFF
ncbi:hypothetical protein ES708_17065 [subsurface metagenome]